MNFHNFYLLYPDMRRGTLFFNVQSELECIDEIIQVHHGVRPNAKLTFSRQRGSKVADIMGSEILLKAVSDRFIGCLQQNNLSGWATFPAQFEGKDGVNLTGVHGLAITGLAGPLLREKAVVHYKKPRKGPKGITRPWEKRGAFFDPSTWDESDIFSPEGTLMIVVTKKTKTILEKAKLTCLDFQNITDYILQMGEDPAE